MTALQDYTTQQLRAELRRRETAPLVALYTRTPRLTYAEIAKALGLSLGTVQMRIQILSKAGKITPRYAGQTMVPTTKTARRLERIKQLRERGKSDVEISRLLGCTRANVGQMVRNHLTYFAQL